MAFPKGYYVLNENKNAFLITNNLNDSMNRKGSWRIQVRGEVYDYNYPYPCTSNPSLPKLSTTMFNRVGSYWKVQEAEARRKEILEEITGVKIEEPKEEKKEKSIGELMEASVIEALSNSTAKALLAVVQPKVEEHIIKTFGILPVKHEIIVGDKKYEFEGIVHEQYDKVSNFIANDIPVFMTGPAGSGKNHLVKDVAKGLGLDFHFTNAVTSEYKLSGFIDANGRYHATAFFNAFSKGGIFMFDEIDASVPEALAYMHAAIANGYCEFPTGHVEAHPDFRVIAAGNTFGTGADLEYVGRFQLDAATLDRFALVHIDYSPAIESAMAGADQEILSFVREFRAALKKIGMKFVVSYRAIERIRKMKDVLSDTDVLKMCLTKSLDKDDLRLVKDNMKISESNRWAKALVV